MGLAEPQAASVGLVLMDMSLRPIAFDRGAALILDGQTRVDADRETVSLLPQDILENIRNRKPSELAAVRMTFRVGHNEYSARAYLMESQNGLFTQPIVALHIERISSATDAVAAVAAKFHLTDREQEALRGISIGLSSKELAERMNISPNTVKVFLRLIMIKMGVTSRGGIVAQILQSQSALEGTPPNEERRLEAVTGA
jgi:DNA-binding CsgD family transcriptional regulator